MSENEKNFDAIIIGAGAAGLFCAGILSSAGKSVLVLEKSAKIGAKILISGGGRCNFTNKKVGIENFVSKNPQFARSALAQYPPEKFVHLVEQYKTPYYEKTLGQLFVDESGGAKRILNMLLQEAENAQIRTDCQIDEIEKDENFTIKTNKGIFKTPSLIIATGGKSIPKMGATGFAFEIAKQFNIKIIEPRPGLVPLVYSGDEYEWLRALSGVSIDAIVSKGKIKFREAVLFTHKGLSGPAILQISNYLENCDQFNINFAPDLDLAAALIEKKQTNPNQKFVNILAEIFPRRFAEVFANDRPINTVKDKELREIAGRLSNFNFPYLADEGFEKAEVTKGGIDTNELYQKSFESKNINGLYFIGECVDMTGWLGGYNFHWAWASGFACANAILNAD